MVIPYLAPFSWYAGGGESDIRKSNRCALSSNRGRLELSVPVAGGGKMLRSERGYYLAEISDHGSWWRTHLGAMEAAYGRTPYYIHLQPQLRPLLENYPTRLSDLCRKLHGVVERFLDMRHLSAQKFTDEATQRGEELLKEINPDFSILDSLMRFGPETILALKAFGSGDNKFR